MDDRKFYVNPNPREGANIFSILTWTWTFGIFKRGFKKVLGVNDLYDPLSTDKSNVLGDRLEKKWFTELERAKRKKRQPSLLWTYFRTFAREFYILALYAIFIELILRLATPILLGALLKYFKPASETTYEKALYYAAAITLANFFNLFSMSHYMFGAFHLGGRMRIATGSVVYRKALRLSRAALGETAPGKIVNLIANEINRLEWVPVYIHHFWTAPLVTIIVIAFMYREVGWPALVGMFVIFSILPFQAYTSKLSSKNRLQTARKTDERVRLMDEIISGVQVIKMYAWEKPFCAMVELARNLELKIVRKNSYLRGVFMTMQLFIARMALYGTLVAMMFSGQRLSMDKVFVYTSYFNLISTTMSALFVRGIADAAECKVVVERLQCFLMSEEFATNEANDESIMLTKKSKLEINQEVQLLQVVDLQDNSVEDNSTSEVNEYESSLYKNWAVRLNHVTAKWNSNSSETTLQDVNLDVAKGKLYVVIGMVGTGKSSLLSTILSELKVIQGSNEVKGSISYADQDAWVFSASVRQNIIFGQEFNEQRYQQVVRDCALQRDFDQFSHGDQTIVGERGRSLSGGQKARINLARAVYREADIYLLDDPLSAVDACVGKQLFTDCIQKYLSGKTRILATHQLQYLEGADAIVLLDQGRVQQFADHHELLRAYPEYQSLIAGEETDDKKAAVEEDTKSRKCDKKVQSDQEDFGKGNAIKDDGFFEKTSRGAVKGNLLINYIMSGTNVVVGLLILFLFLATQFCVSFHDYFIPILVSAEESRYYNATYLNDENVLPRNTYIYVYTTLTLSIFVVGIVRSFALFTVCKSCSQRLHDLAFGALIRATTRFFDTNPSGRILNRFSKDLGCIDELLPLAILDVGQLYLLILGFLVVTCSANFLLLLPLLLIGSLLYILQRIYFKTSMNVKRLEGTTRSPVFTHLSATLNGLTTIRAYKSESILTTEFDRLQDTHTSTWYMFMSTNSAFGFSVDFFCFVFVALVTFSFLLLKDTFSDGAVGLAITQAMTITLYTRWCVRQTAEMRNQLTAVERVIEYSQLPSEPNLRDKGVSVRRKMKSKKNEDLIDPPKDWPSEGRIEFKNVFMRYSDDDPLVLRKISLIVQAGEKVGIVGRTGAGKSSLIAALFRLTKLEGVITVDEIDTNTIALEDLRKSISIIPQDPVLFSGTLRRNLDPFDKFSDESLWKVLEEVELKDFVNLSGNGLDHRVQDRGSNFSTGQRQLLCLARAILRNNRILVLDEATANVDPHTDALVQRTIRTKFASCTVLTVAHRLNTIMDSDKILAMDNGEAVEFDHPYVLLQIENGLFSSLVKETGKAMYDQLYQVAYDSYLAKFGS